MRRSKVKSLAVLWGSVLLGNALLAFGVAAFVLPHGLLSGGTTGIGIALSKLTGRDTALFVLLLNLGLLGFGLFSLGKRFFLTTAASSVLYPVLLSVMQRTPGIDALTDDRLLSALYAGGLIGIALGLVMRVGSSTGGLDVLNLALHRWLHLPVATLVWITDVLVIGFQALFSTAQQTLLGMLVLLLETLVLNQVMLLGRAQLQIFVVSERHDAIRDELLHRLGYGVTMVLIETGHLEKPQKGVLCVVHPRRLYSVTTCIHAIDPQAFITVTKIKEVQGQGFTLSRIPIEKE